MPRGIRAAASQELSAGSNEAKGGRPASGASGGAAPPSRPNSPPPRPPRPRCPAPPARPASSPSLHSSASGGAAPPTPAPPTPPASGGATRPARLASPRRVRPRLLSSSRAAAAALQLLTFWRRRSAPALRDRRLWQRPTFEGPSVAPALPPPRVGRPRGPAASSRVAPPGGCSHVAGAGGGEPAHGEHLPGKRVQDGPGASPFEGGRPGAREGTGWELEAGEAGRPRGGSRSSPGERSGRGGDLTREHPPPPGAVTPC